MPVTSPKPGPGANAPERLLVGLRFLAFAVFTFVRGADEAALDDLRDRLDILEAERLVETVKLRNALIREAAKLLPEAIRQAKPKGGRKRKDGTRTAARAGQRKARCVPKASAVSMGRRNTRPKSPCRGLNS